MPQLGEVGFRTKSVTTRTPTAPITDVVGVVGVMDIVGVPVVMDVVGVLIVIWMLWASYSLCGCIPRPSESLYY